MNQSNSDVILIGGGIMSATLGTMLRELAPDWKITVFERLDQLGAESSDPWNNAGTGHAALCELNYTAENPDGSVDISKAVKINQEFQVSRQFWSYLAEKGHITEPRNFITPLPHLSYIQGQDNVKFLRKRFEALSKVPLFKGMEYTEDAARLEEWMPLIMKNRTVDKPMAATRTAGGTDVDFGALTRMLFKYLASTGAEINLNSNVADIGRLSNGLWELKVKNTHNGELQSHTARFVFIGGGGGSLPLLQKSGIPEGKGIGGFPVSGIFLVCQNPELVSQHYAKVYGRAPLGAPPMSVPHLDTRFIDGKPSLLFGPFAGFSPKFLKNGSVFDLLTSIKPHNLITMLASGVKNMALTAYLIKQVMLSKEQRMEALREFVPGARSEDWEVLEAGQRVQIIKNTAEGKGMLQFGTEVINAADGSIAALLGASPGASTAVSVMLGLIKTCFPGNYNAWEPKIKEMVPSYGIALADNPELNASIQAETSRALELDREQR